MTELEWLEDEQLITSRQKPAEMPNAEPARLGELDHAISIYQFPMFHCPFATE